MERKTIDISLDTLINECFLNKDLSYEHKRYIENVNRENIHDVFSYKKFNNDFVSELSCYCDDNSFIGRIRPSYDYFLKTLVDILNLDNKENISDDQELTEKLMERVNLLKSITTMEQLYKEFPKLYYDLIDGRSYYKSLQKFKGKGIREQKEYEEGEHYYYSCALRRSLENFIPAQTAMYTRYVEGRHKLKERIEHTSYNPYLSGRIDINKLAMYVIHKYLLVCENSSDKKQIQECLYKVNMYLKDSKYDKNVSIKTEDGILVNINNIKERLNNITKREPSRIVPWILIPKGREYDKVHKGNNKPRTILFDSEKIKKLREIGQDKNNFYESTDYIAKVIGIGTCKGYVGYIYKNGEVILDREYDDSKPYTAQGNAIYSIRVEDFDTLTKLNKKALMKSKKAKKICHVNGWKDKIDSIIEREATDQDIESTNKLLRKLKRVN